MEVLLDYLFMFNSAIVLTLRITLMGILFGTVIGLIMGLFRVSRILPLQYIARIYISIIRGTPLLLQILTIYMVIGSLPFINLDRIMSASIALAIHNGAYIAEIFRGAIISIANGQMEASRSLGMSHSQSMRRIILPQALKRAIPPLGNQFSIALKDSSLASVIGVREIIQTSRTFVASTFNYEIFFIAGLYYWIITTIISLIVDKVEKKLSVGER
ncbi:amino acid ABC transporter permease [Alkalicella caledoniensis]|nr:amino acid ABC transporter permease [Alkalicella caledoniensis]